MLPHRSQYSYNGDIVNFCFFTQTNKSQLFLNLLRVFYTSIFRRAIRSELQLIARYTSTVQIAVTWRLSKCLTMPRYIMTQCNVVYAGCNSGRVATLSRSGDVIQEINDCNEAQVQSQCFYWWHHLLTNWFISQQYHDDDGVSRSRVFNVTDGRKCKHVIKVSTGNNLMYCGQ